MALVLCLLIAFAAGGTADAKKKKKKSTSFTGASGLVPIPDRPAGATTVDGKAASTFTVGKKYKGLKVDAVNVTLQTIGSAPGAANQIQAFLISPTGRTAFLFSNLGGSGPTGITSLGPLTQTADSPVNTCDQTTPPCANPFSTLNRPFAGTAGNANLEIYEGRSMQGTWTVVWLDNANTLTSSAQATLAIKPQKVTSS